DEAPRAALLAATVFLSLATGSGAWRAAELPGGAEPLFAEVVRRWGAAGLPVALGTVPVPDGTPPALGVVTGPGDT
ncbi:precorrin-3B synthase, partial [Streptomyces sp. SID7909]|nr:precorrin-3B synthase [Streptomyces sp. SID7909]